LRTPFFQAILVFCVVLVLSSYLSPHSSAKQGQLQSVLLQLVLVLGLPLAVNKLLNLNAKVVFKLRSTSFRNLLLTLILTLCLVLLLEEINYLQSRFIAGAANLNNDIRRFLRVNSLPQLIWLFLSMAIIPGVCEEFLFRGYILSRLLGQDNQWQSIMISSVLFGLFHQDLRRLLPATLAGVMLAFIAIRSGSLYNAIASHIFVDAWGIIASNFSFPAYLPWLSPPGHVPWVVQAICIAGIFLAGKLLNQTRAGDRETGQGQR
jgi:sodium transport system permease protein